MGISSDGQICYGIAFEEEYEFPWLDEEWDGDEEEWWITGICGYKPPFEIYNEQGGHIDGERPSKERSDEYYDNHSKFKDAHPMPVEIISHCSYDYTMYFIAVPGTYTRASSGYPEKFKIESVTPEQEKDVIDFCEKYLRAEDSYCEFPEMKLYWFLSSMYG